MAMTNGCGGFGSEGMAYADNVSESTVKRSFQQPALHNEKSPSDFTVRYRETPNGNITLY